MDQENMKWCPYCRKYVQTRVKKIKIKKRVFFTYHCFECNGFIESGVEALDLLEDIVLGYLAREREVKIKS